MGLTVTRFESEFISCFDKKNRNFHLLIKQSNKEMLNKILNAMAIERYANTEIIKILRKEDMVCGAIAIDDKGLLKIGCKSIILASGGMPHLFKYQFGNDNPAVLGQFLALEAGATLTNIEFIQMLFGFMEPCPKTFFSDRTLKYCDFYDPFTNEKILYDNESTWNESLQMRSTHGPFSSELLSKYVDITVYTTQKKNKKGVLSKYKEEIKSNKWELLETHFELLKKEKGINRDDPIILGCYYHASNGGIKIDKYANTGIKGLFGCGEVTTGMHGADRIGGTSIANCIVFGSIAGREAAKYSKSVNINNCENYTLPLIYKNSKDYIDKIQDVTFDTMMICRNEKGLETALLQFKKIETEINNTAQSFSKETSAEALRVSVQLKSILHVARAMAEVQLLRRESRGAHYREDYPEHNAGLSKNILVSLKPDSYDLNVGLESK
jgi:L-aspartate oxidase